MLKIVTWVLYVNCNTLVNALQLRNVPEKFTTFGFKSNNVDGTDVNALHAEKQDANVVANGTLLNKLLGNDVKYNIDENVSVKVVAYGE